MTINNDRTILNKITQKQKKQKKNTKSQQFVKREKKTYKRKKLLKICSALLCLAAINISLNLKQNQALCYFESKSTLV